LKLFITLKPWLRTGGGWLMMLMAC